MTTHTNVRPNTRPQKPHFSSGPCAKRPGWKFENLKNALLGRSHRSKPGKARLKRAIDLTRPRVLHDLLWGLGREHAIDRVVHCMHHRHPDGAGASIHAQNVDATRELLLACERHPTIRRLVYRSFAEVYALRHTTSNLLDENEPLDFDPIAPQWRRDRVEADLTVCSHLEGPLSIAVPEPAAWVILLTGMLAIFSRRSNSPPSPARACVGLANVSTIKD